MTPTRETPLDRLGQLTFELTKNATRADVTGEPRIVVTHEWAEDMIETVHQVRVEHRKPTGQQSWADTPWPAKVLIASLCVASAAALLALALVAAGWGWNQV